MMIRNYRTCENINIQRTGSRGRGGWGLREGRGGAMTEEYDVNCEW